MPPEDPQATRTLVSRRSMLAGSGAAGVALYLERSSVFGVVGDPTAARARHQRKTPQFTVTARRRDDFLSLRFTFVNLQLTGGKSPKLKRAIASKPAYVIVTFPPQHVAEEAYVLSASARTTEKPKPPGQSRARVAADSRLVFEVPKNVSIPYDLDHLLDWAKLTPSLVPAATATKKRRGVALRAPESTETALELPWRLAVSPGKGAVWAHDLDPVDPGGQGWVELWHTRLGHLVTASSPKDAVSQLPAANPGPKVRVEGGPIRAVWAYDSPFKKTGKLPDGHHLPFRTSLDVPDRVQIVRASSDVGVKGRKDVDASRLWLSSMGGFLDAHGVWALTAADLDIEEWRHDATLGRDHYVKVVRKGFLFPFGHKAVQMTLTERRFEKVGSSKVVAVLRQRTYLVVREPVKSYAPGGSYGLVSDSRDLPFRSIKVTTLVSPDLDGPAAFTPSVNAAFVPKIGGGAFRFHMIGTDWVGRTAEFTSPVVFVPRTSAFDGDATAVRDAYNALAPGSDVRLGVFSGSSVALAASVARGDTDVDVRTITWGARDGVAASDTSYRDHDQPRCYPKLSSAEVRLAAAEQAAGGQPLPTTPVVSYDTVYVDHGFSNDFNSGRVFAKVQPASVPKLDFGAGSSGGVLTPNIAIGGLSRSLGPVGGDSDVVRGGMFSPDKFFGGVEAKILGGVDLLSLVLPEPLGGDVVSDRAMKLSYRTTADALETSLVWKPDIDPAHDVVKKENGFLFEIDATIRTDLKDPTHSTYDVVGDLRGFAVSLIGDGAAQFIVIHFNSLMFTTKTGQSSHVDVDIANVEFKGVLEFVEKLKEYLSLGGEGGPTISVTPTGISADLAVPIPNIQLGVFGISNIALAAGFNLPFSGKPARFRFGFSTRENPFALQVSIFGGGGFFGLAIGTDGVELIEAGLEFGAMCAIDIGVASGSVHLLAGIYFSYGTDDTHTDPTCVLTGYVRLGGELSVLAIVTVSLEFYMGLTYESSPSKKVYGEATVTVEISILCFSKTISATARRQFGNSEGDPTFAEQIPQAAWNDYCDAFATT